MVPILIGGLFGPLAVRGGDLAPPPGPISPTQRTLISSLPFTISQAGSYVVTRDLSGTDGITINASNVTIDLNGFTLAPSGGSADGISSVATLRNIKVINGTLRDWDFAGIYLPLATNCEIRNLRVYNTNLEGIQVGANALIVDCLVDGAFTATKGIVAGDNSIISRCVCTACTVSGIKVGANGIITACTARQNTSFGIQAGDQSTVVDCTASSNAQLGISVGAASAVSNCVASGNSASGIMTGDGSTITSCTTAANGTAIPGGHGIVVASGCSVINCTSRNNGQGTGGGSGISVADRCSVSGCNAAGNKTEGIRISGRSGLVANNYCAGNGTGLAGPGIHLLAGTSGWRVDSNHLENNDRGLQIAGPGNIVTRNSATNNVTNYNIVAGNDVGPIGSAAASTSPWANLEF